MIPVLALDDPAEGAGFLCTRLGFSADPADPQLLRFGTQALRLVHAGQPVQGLIDLPFDHLALRVPDPDAAQSRAIALGARMHPAFTPDGPREIAEFGPVGVRFVFFQGPEGWPFEFVAPRNAPPGLPGHDHFGLRSLPLAPAESHLAEMGATLQSRHSLHGPDAAVSVTFLQLGAAVFELFDEPASQPPVQGKGWVGFLR